MRWRCPECGSLTEYSAIKCTCGYEATGAEAAEAKRGKKIVTKEDKINKTVKHAWIAGLFIGAVSLVFTLIFIITDVDVLGFGVDAGALIDVFVIFGLTFGIYKKSRTCAILLFIHFVGNKILMLVDAGMPADRLVSSLPMTAVLGYYLFEGIRGTFAYHKVIKKDAVDSKINSVGRGDLKKKSRGLKLAVITLIVLLVFAFTILIKLFIFGSISSIAIADGKIISCSWDKTIKIWDLETGQLINTIEGGEDWLPSVGVAGKRIVAASLDNTIKIWNLETGRLLNTLKGHTDNVVAVVIEDQRIISGSHDKTIKIWELETGRLLNTLKGHSRGVTALSATESKIISGSAGNTIKIWDLKTGTLLNTFVGHTGGISSLAVDSGRIVSGSSDGTIKVWSLKTGDLLNTLTVQSVFGLSAPVNAVAVADKKIISSCATAVIVWDLETGMYLRTLLGHKGTIWSLATTNDRIVSGAHDNTIRVWDIESGSLLKTLDHCPPYRICIKF